MESGVRGTWIQRNPALLLQKMKFLLFFPIIALCACYSMTVIDKVTRRYLGSQLSTFVTKSALGDATTTDVEKINKNVLQVLAIALSFSVHAITPQGLKGR